MPSSAMPDQCVPLSILAARLRLAPGVLYQRAIARGIVVRRTARRAFVEPDDAARLEREIAREREEQPS